MGGAAGIREAGAPVWDPLVRLGHWLLVLSVAVAWLTRHRSDFWHEFVGYVALGIISLRIVWGLLGSTQARFANFVRGPGATLVYARQMMRGEESRYIGHNPLGAWMIIALITAIIIVSTSGWLYTTDAYWGVEWVETLHRRSSYVLYSLAGLHIAGVLHASYRHRENLIAAMIHGRKRQ